MGQVAYSSYFFINGFGLKIFCKIWTTSKTTSNNNNIYISFDQHRGEGEGWPVERGAQEVVVEGVECSVHELSVNFESDQQEHKYKGVVVCCCCCRILYLFVSCFPLLIKHRIARSTSWIDCIVSSRQGELYSRF